MVNPGRAIKKRHWLQAGILYILSLVLVVFFVGPLFWMVVTSLKSPAQLYSYTIFPRPIAWNNYITALRSIPFFRQLTNTVIIVVVNVVGQLLSSSFVAFGFARLRSPWKNRLFALVLATMMVPQVATLIPSYILFKELGWIDTFLPLTVPAFTAHPFNIFLLRVFYQGIPIELDEAARVDGASSLAIWHRVILPLSKPVLTTIAVFTFQNTWNDFMGPLIYLQTPEWFTLQLGLASFAGMYSVDWVSIMAASAVIMLPCVLVFIFAQRFFTESLAFAGLKE
ncbi:MAG: carbohydrate ABC transporter permease [Firmicutes bacterium]|nr:carbohydrate ABC transporter permease [Bacillota bacterium]